jgi:CheY-like chemotaxis protein
VRSISELIRTSVPRTVDLVMDLGENLPSVEGDASQIQQLVMNLILNAVEATGEKPGTVRVTTRLTEVHPGDRVNDLRPTPPPPGRYVVIEVADVGCGMSEEVKAQIFDPFFTTKFTGRGLGLAAALGIVRGHKGAIDVESVEHEGSTFTVLLPALPESEQTAIVRDAGGAQKTATSGGVVLVVDDEDVVRRTARTTLEHHGHTVFEAADGRDGADLFSRLHDRLSAVLLDLTMPHMDGHDVWKYIRRIRPDMKIVISSGFDESEAMKHFAEEPDLHFIQKPYTAAALASKIKAVLEER